MKLMNVMIAALGLIFVTAIPSFALDPLCAPVEGFGIKSATAMEVNGSATNDQKYYHQVNCGEVTIQIIEDSCPNCPPSEPLYQGTFPLAAGALTYEDTNNAVNGVFALSKDFAAHGQADASVDNLEASKVVAFVGSGSGGRYQAVERGSLQICQTTGLGWTIAQPQQGPTAVCVAGCGRSRQLAIGSSLDVTEVQASTQTSFNMLGSRVGGSHNIDADGTGTVKASMIANLAENVFRILHDGGCGVAGTPPCPGGAGSEGTYIASSAGSSEASGIWSFHKKMVASFDVEAGAGAVASGNGSLLSLCPWGAPAPQLGLTP